MSARILRILPMLLLTLCLCACGRAADKKTVVVVREETPAPSVTELPAENKAAAPAETAAPAASDWYGWWRMFDTSGDWAHMYGYYWDCCAEIREEGGSLRFQLWDEDLSKYIGLASARLIREGGALRCAAGAFLDRELAPEDWTVTVTEDDCGTLLKIEGKYTAVGKGGFSYEIFLRPWGSLWPGKKDEKPGYYDSWYLPLIEAGVKMPEEIGKGT